MNVHTHNRSLAFRFDLVSGMHWFAWGQQLEAFLPFP